MPIPELSMGLLAGLAASAHCVGMCGAFPLHLSRSSQRSPVAVRQLLYIAGKLFTYVFLGGLFGALGSTLAGSGLLPQSQRTLAILAGVVILLFGLGMVGVPLPSLLAGKVAAHEWGAIKRIYGHFFTHPGAVSSFLLGMATGFLPCPITLAMLAVATGSHSVVKGIALLAGLGLGTAPALVAVGLLGNLVDARWRRIGLRPAGVIILLLGVMTIARTQGFMHRGCHAAASPVTCSCAECRALGHMCPRCAAAKGR